MRIQVTNKAHKKGPLTRVCQIQQHIVSLINFHRYVELLEYEQTQLVAGLRELYHRLRSMEGLKTNPLGNEPHGSSLIHEILEELGILRQDGQSEINENYEGSDTTQNIFEAEFTYATGRKEPLHTGSDGDRSPVFEPVDFHEPDDPLNLSVAQHCSTTLVEMPNSSSIHTSFLHEPKVSSQPTNRPSQAAWQLGISRLSAMEFESPLSEEISLPDMMASEAELFQNHAGMLVDPCLMMTEC